MQNGKKKKNYVGHDDWLPTEVPAERLQNVTEVTSALPSFEEL